MAKMNIPAEEKDFKLCDSCGVDEGVYLLKLKSRTMKLSRNLYICQWCAKTKETVEYVAESFFVTVDTVH